MRVSSAHKLPDYQIIGPNLRIHWDHREVERQGPDGETVTSWECQEAAVPVTASRSQIIEAVMATKYPTPGAEFAAIQNNATEHAAMRRLAKRLAEGQIALSLEEAKESKRQEINSIRDQKETEGFVFNGTLFDSDERSAARIAVASQAATSAILASQPFEVTWTAADNSEHVLDAPKVLDMNAALAQHGLVLHETAKQYKRKVDAATTHEELKAIVWE